MFPSLGSLSRAEVHSLVLEDWESGRRLMLGLLSRGLRGRAG